MTLPVTSDGNTRRRVSAGAPSSAHPVLLGLLAGILLPGCLVDRSGISISTCDDDADCSRGFICHDRECQARPASDASTSDAGADASTDSGADSGPLDAGDAGFLPEHCLDGELSGDESDVDCGGSCDGCVACKGCTAGTDCSSGACEGGRCQPTLRTVGLPGGAVEAFVREDGAVLLAHYAPGTSIRGYDQAVAQMADVTGGRGAPPGWAPDPCFESGHLDMTAFAPAGRTVRLECGADGLVEESVSAVGLFTDFESGVKGVVGAVGEPGWGVVAAVDSGQGRGSAGMCGSTTLNTGGGIAYCSGPGASGDWSNHLVSFASYLAGTTASIQYVACGSRNCSGPDCDLEVWVWLE